MEQCRDMRGSNFLEELTRDLALACRALKKSPGFTLTALLSLALGIGANTAVFTLINTLVFPPMQVEAPRQLVRAITYLAK